MLMNEIASAAGTLELWKMVNDSVWASLQQLQRDEREREAAAKRSAPSKRKTSSQRFQAPPKPPQLPPAAPHPPAALQAATKATTAADKSARAATPPASTQRQPAFGFANDAPTSVDDDVQTAFKQNAASARKHAKYVAKRGV